MNIEIINTGSELMLGFVLNTHQQWICRQLADAGYNATRQVAIADHGPAIQQAVREAMARADFIIVTGGLGPTSDDLTRDLIAELLGKKLYQDAAILAQLENFFQKRGRKMPESTKVQAMVPDGATVLENPHGTAPGLAMEINPNPFRAEGGRGTLVMLPGPPRELRPMFTNLVMPWLQRQFPLKEAFVCRTLRTTGVGESLVEEKIAAPLKPLIAAGLELGYCAHYDGVDVRVIGRGRDAVKVAAEAEAIVRAQLGPAIFGEQDEKLNEVVVRMLAERRQTLALAESCTGGFLANLITNVPGASAVFLGGVVSYSNEAKKNLLGVQAETLDTHGAVSEATAREMARGARARFQADYGIGITGIAGPGGGTADKPVGTVFVALATPGQTLVLNPVNRYDRLTFKQMTAGQALDLLRRNLPKKV